MKHQSKQNTESAQEEVQVQSQQTSGREFASVEEALREDIQQTVVPPAVEHRLSKSIAGLPKPGRTWWKRLMG